MIGLTVAAGLGAAFGSWSLRSADQWWSTMLANMSVVILLLVPGEFLLSRLGSEFRRIERATDEIRATADSAKQTAEQTARSLQDVRDTLIDRQRAEHESELDIYRTLVHDPSRESLIKALRQATTAEIVTSEGVRSPVWWTDLHYRYVVDKSGVDLEVQLETDSGEVLSSHEWSQETSPDDFYQGLVQAVRDAGRDLGVGLNDPTESVKGLSEMLVDVTRLRSQEPMGHRSSLRRIIERVDGWYFTENNVIPANDLHYLIAVSRLNETDWEDHLLKKRWGGAATAIPFARRLYGIVGH